MSKHDFEAAEFETRQRNVRAAMEARGLDLLVVIAPTNIQYLIGTRTKSYQEFQCLLFPLSAEHPMVMLTRLAEVPEYTDLSLADEVHGWGGREPEEPTEALHRLLKHHGYLHRRIGLEIPYYYLSVHDHARLRALLADADVVEASRLVEDIKLVKSAAEIAYLRRAARITDQAMQVAAAMARPGVSECQIAGAVYQSLLAQGGDSPASPINLVSGERSCYPHGAPTERALAPGDSVNIEFGGAYRRYCTTIGRQLCVGDPAPRLVEVYTVVRAACDACIERMRPGVPAVDPHLAAKRVIAEAGFDRYRIHTSGYGIAPGYPPSWGESIHLFGDSDHVLKAGMMLSVEPPVYIHQERLGVRLIDNVLVGEDGPELLTTFDRDLLRI